MQITDENTDKHWNKDIADNNSVRRVRNWTK